MNTHFLVTVQTDERTRFGQDPEYFRRELRAFAQRLFKSETTGSIPAVTVTTVNAVLEFAPPKRLAEIEVAKQ